MRNLSSIVKKPHLIIKCNGVNFKYARLEKIPVLRDNFLVSIACKTKEKQDVAETTALDLARKIKAVPNLSSGNVIMILRPPKENVSREYQKRWRSLVRDYQHLIGSQNVVFNPNKNEFISLFEKKGKDHIIIEVTHTEDAIILEGGEKITTADVLQMADLSHIKYLLAGNSCSLPQIDSGELAAAFRKKGVGLMNLSHGKVSMDTVLDRLEILKYILENTDLFDVPAYYIPDIIDQSTRIRESEKGTTNWGEIEDPKMNLVVGIQRVA